ncbi:MAG: lytic transglycosylase domain-containing protein [Candidatus Gastranaerophilales bacterium]|nr:lytic transglycosylase domain-containing protein [Candidatus Gastranaerophilales bacterium]
MARQKVIIYVLAVFFAFISLPLKSNAEAVSKVTIKELIVKHSVEMGLDPALALSIAKAESGFSHDKKSPYGAVGVFQLMPSTAKKMGYNPYHLQDNIKGGIAYYKKMYNMFGSTELALAAYNAGPGNVKRYNGIPPFTETKKFVSSIMNNYNTLKTNPDPSIAGYKKDEKAISNDEKNINYEVTETDFRMQQDAILKAYLSNLGI